MTTQEKLNLPKSSLRDFCRRNHIRKLALFGSILRNDFQRESDVDVLVEFEPGHVPGYIRLAGLEQEFSEMIGGRLVAINTSKCLSRYFQDEVISESEVLYVER